MGALYSLADYKAALLALLPSGRLWPKEEGAVQTQAVQGLAAGFNRLDARSQYLLRDAFPPTAVELLPDWEATLGLPDPCAGPLPTLAQRQQQVVARFASSGGQSVPYFINFAAQLGFTITITEFAPASFGHATFGSGMYGADWIHAWQVNAPANTTTLSRYGDAVFGDPYSATGNAVLECELNARKPADTILLFAYT